MAQSLTERRLTGKQLNEENAEATSQNIITRKQAQTAAFLERVEWVRRLNIGPRVVGVGFVDGKLSYVDAAPAVTPDAACAGGFAEARATQISLRQSTDVLQDFLKAEQLLGAEIEVDESGCARWLSMLSTVLHNANI